MPDIRSYAIEKPSDPHGTGKEARGRLSKLITRRAQLDELNIQTQPIYGPRGASMKLREIRKSAAHPGFAAVERKIAQQPGIRNAGAVLAARTREASESAKRSNPRLLRVKGA